ncbi:MAG: 4Fe-4S dicluster domain-containing protein, partial [Parachlamydiaceae bacterium]|nr:4Fe-4S dicluster domain-containing protein [Parachlamydiaceae bacterium]
YNLDQLLKSFPCNLSKLIAGSEGTLGIASQIKVKIAKKIKNARLCIIHVQDMLDAMKSIEDMLIFHPVALEIIDYHILEMGRLSPAVKNKLTWLQGNPQAIFVAEFAGESARDVDEVIIRFKNRMQALNIGYAHVILSDPQQMSHVWQVRKAGLGLLLSKRTYSRAIAFIEDLTVAPKNLAPFMLMLTEYLKGIGKEVGIYGHIGSGCMHIRPFIDLRNPDEVSQMKTIMQDVADMVLSFSGGLSGEHGDGLIRSWLNKKMFGEELYQAFVELKTAFDPRNLMNPGKIVHASEISLNTLRLNPEVKQVTLPTFLDFSAEGGIELAADLCNGNGQCRKGEGVMCPSFQATGDEYDTTRARAQSLRAIINGRLPKEEFTGKALYDVLDLCLECKGCKTECPSQVDMAKMKSEFLYQYQQKHGYKLRSRLFANIATINRLSRPFAIAFNYINSSKLIKYFLNLIGIAPQRNLPKLASESFSSWFKNQHMTPLAKKIVLFNDTYTEYNHPEIGKATFKVLTKLGYEIILVSDFCCGRPLISKGFLNEAKSKALKLVNTLKPHAASGLKIICLEPSCLSALNDDYKGLIGSKDAALFGDLSLVSQACSSLEDFLNGLVDNNQLPLSFKENSTQILLHGHCHQKSLIGMQTTLNVLRVVPGFSVKEIESGCCGVAGSFGYESEHYDISMKIGNLHLLPAVKKAPAEVMIVANGMSCRSQIHHGAERQAFHLAEVISNYLA